MYSCVCVCVCVVFADYSLVQKCVMREEDSSPLYTIHDIIMDYLKGSMSKLKQVDIISYVR